MEKEAQRRFPGGVVIGSHFDTSGARLAATRDAIAHGERVLFEASFAADGVQVRADVLLREGDTWTLVEVKSSSETKDEHIPDAAVQLHILRRSGLAVTRVEIMHLNRDHLHPDVGDLLVREDVTARAAVLLPAVPERIADQLATLGGALPAVPIGANCSKPRECPFWDRCWPQVWTRQLSPGFSGYVETAR